MTVYTWDDGGSDSLWTNADNWDVNGVPQNDATGVDTIVFPDGAIVDVSGSDMSVMANGIGALSPVGDLTFTEPTSDVYFKLGSNGVFQSPSTVGKQFSWPLGGDAGLASGVTVTFEKTSSVANNEMFSQLAHASNGHLNMQFRDAYGYAPRYHRVSTGDGTTGITLQSALPATWDVGDRCLLAGDGRGFYTSISAISGDRLTITLNDSYATYDPWFSLQYESLAFVMCESNINYIGAYDATLYMTQSAEFCRFMGEMYGFFTLNGSGVPDHSGGCEWVGAAHRIDRVSENGTENYYRLACVGGGHLINVSTLEYNDKGLYVGSTAKSHHYGDDNSCFYNFTYMFSSVGAVAGSGMRNIRGTYAYANEFFNNPDDTETVINLLNDATLIRMNSTDQAVFVAGRGSVPIYPIMNNLRLEYSYRLLNLVNDDPITTMLYINGLIGRDSLLSNNDITDYIDISGFQNNNHGKIFKGVCVRDMDIEDSGTHKYSYWLNLGEHGTVIRGEEGSQYDSGNAPGDITDSAKWVFETGTGYLFVCKNIGLVAGQSISASIQVHLDDLMDVNPRLELRKWENRIECNMPNKLVADAMGLVVSDQDSGGIGVTRRLSINAVAPVTGFYQIVCIAKAPDNNLEIYGGGSEPVLWTSDIEITYQNSEGIQRTITRQIAKA